MANRVSQAELDQRWDLHTDRQLAVAKAGIAAVTVLNSGSWIALLSQADKIIELSKADDGASPVFLYWGVGALLGTLLWLFMYLSAGTQALHDYDREKTAYHYLLEFWRILGILCFIAALGMYLMGVISLSQLAAAR